VNAVKLRSDKLLKRRLCIERKKPFVNVSRVCQSKWYTKIYNS